MKVHLLVAVYLAAIILANLTVALAPPLWIGTVVIVNAVLLIGLDLTAGDRLHEAWRGHLVPRFAALIAAGSLLSFALNGAAGPVAVVSCAAFGLAAVTDRLMYAALDKFSWYVRANGSNVVSALVDSAVFLSGLALAGLLPWPSVPLLMAAQWGAKVGGGLIWSWLLRGRR